jgi:hypothetical protein
MAPLLVINDFSLSGDTVWNGAHMRPLVFTTLKAIVGLVRLQISTICGAKTIKNAESEAAKSLDPLFNETIRALQAQSRTIDSLDAKANFSLGASSLLTAAVTAVRVLGVPSEEGTVYTLLAWGLRHLGVDPHPITVQNWLSAAALVCFLALSFCSLQVYRLREFREFLNPLYMLEKYGDCDPRVTKQKTLDTLASDFPKNRRAIQSKERWLGRTHWLLFCESTELVLLLAVTLL